MLGKPEYIVVWHANHGRNPVMIVELKRPNMLRTGGKQAALLDIQDYVEARFADTCHDVLFVLFGLVGITWSVWKMKRGHVYTPTSVQAWRSIASDLTDDARGFSTLSTSQCSCHLTSYSTFTPETMCY